MPSAARIVGGRRAIVEIGMTPGSATRLRGWRGQFVRATPDIIEESGTFVGLLGAEEMVAIRRNFAIHNQTMQTMRSMRMTVRGLTATISIEHGALFVEYGTRPHRITARAGGTLAYVFASGEQGFSRSVMHPGQRADPFLERSIEEVGTEKQLRRLGTNVFARMSSRVRRLP